MLAALASMAVIALGLGALLGYAAVRFRREGDPLADAIDKALPQTQCGQCRYPGCRPYAEAIARGEAEINRCAPGGELGVRTLAQLLGRDPVPLEDGIAAEKPRQVAWIDEATCIGCTKCIQACPVDAIIGAPKLMHSVLSVECTGCELCIAPCPVDCIHLVPAERGIAAWRPAAPRQPLAALVESATVH